MNLTKKQSKALDLLQDSETKELMFGGGAGGAKSFLGCYWILKQAFKYPETKWLLGRAKLKTLKETTLVSLFKVAKIQNISSNVLNFNQQAGVIALPNGSQILLKDLFYYPSDPDFDELGSLELTGAFIDEIPQITFKAWDIVKSRCGRAMNDEYNLIPKILGCGNPSHNWVYDYFYKPSINDSMPQGRAFIQALVHDNPFISHHYIENLQTLDEASKQRLYYGNWDYETSENDLFDIEAIGNLFTNDYVIGGKQYLTVDAARLGGDKAVIVRWSGFRVEEIKTYPKTRIDELSGIVKELATTNNIPMGRVICDEDGVGGGIVDILHCKGFVNNSTPINKENYQNLKTQCYYKFAELVNENKIHICNANFAEDIRKELTATKRDKQDEDGKLKITPKDRIKQAIGRSPDIADALAFRMYWEIAPTKLTFKSQSSDWDN